MLGFFVPFQKVWWKLSPRRLDRAGLRFCQSPLMSLSIWATSKDQPFWRLEKNNYLWDVAFGFDVWGVMFGSKEKIICFFLVFCLFIFVGSLVTVNFRNLDFHLKKHKNIYVFVVNLEVHPLRSLPSTKPAAGPIASQRVLRPPWRFPENGAENSQVRAPTLMINFTAGSANWSSTRGTTGPGGLGFSRLGV